MMRLRLLRLVGLPALAILASASAFAQSPAERVAQAERDWNAGRYDAALEALAAVLRAPGGDALVPRIARLTGEPFRTVEASSVLSGTAAWQPRWSADGRRIAFEAGIGAARRLYVMQYGDTVRQLAVLEGTGAVFSPDGEGIMYLVPRGGGEPPIVRAYAFAMERSVDLATGPLSVSEMAFGADGSLLAIASSDDSGVEQVYGWSRGSMDAPVALTSTPTAKSGLLVVSGGRHIVYSVSEPQAGGRGGRGGGRGGRGGGRGGGGAGARFEVFEADTRAVAGFTGRSIAVARSGAALAYLSGGGAEPTAIMRLSLTERGEPQKLFETANNVASPAISPDGSRVAFQMMPREDWDLYVVGTDGEPPVRVTHDIQHDLSPQFLSDNTLLGLIGEARHRRAHTYDLASLARTKVFHNNSVRTISAEYDWVPSPDGTKLLVVAERDGDTVTPHRFLFLTDLTRAVTQAAVAARVDSALAAERALRQFASRAFTPIDAGVRDAVAQVDVGRIYEHARTLYAFGSKHIMQPGNARAIAYLEEQYRSFGYGARVRRQEFDTPAGGGRGGGGGTIRTANVIAVLPGTESPELVYVVGSHFDSVQPGPGADDNSSGTTALLEAARVLATRPQPATIMFVSFTGEEAGLRGSREFVRQAQADSMRLVGALNNDMVGFANDERLDNTIRYSNPGIRDIQHAAALRYTNLITYDAFYYKSTDAAAFYDAYGDIVGGIGSYPVLGNPHYHQSHDVLETINQQLVAEVSKTTVATLMMLASSPSRLVNVRATREGSAVDVSWTPSPERNIVRYIVTYGAPGSATPRRVTVTDARARLTDVPAGAVISVKAVNVRGIEGWDWARVTVQ